jgi:hypothetical protein
MASRGMCGLSRKGIRYALIIDGEMTYESNDVIDELVGRESAVTTFVADNPNASKDESLEPPAAVRR